MRGRETQHTLLCTSECPGTLCPQPSANCPGCCRREGQRQLPRRVQQSVGVTVHLLIQRTQSTCRPPHTQQWSRHVGQIKEQMNNIRSLSALTLSGLTPTDSSVLQTRHPALPAFLPHHFPTKPAARTRWVPSPRWDGRSRRTRTASPGV